MFGTFTVTGNVTINVGAWQAAGYGPAINETTLKKVIYGFLNDHRHPGTALVVNTYYNRGNNFSVYVKMSVTTPWWKLGFGSRTSRMEVEELFRDALNGYASVTNVVVKATR